MDDCAVQDGRVPIPRRNGDPLVRNAVDHCRELARVYRNTTIDHRTVHDLVVPTCRNDISSVASDRAADDPRPSSAFVSIRVYGDSIVHDAIRNP